MLNPSQSNVLIIASMHRSGSSVTAAILQSAGVYIGRELLSPNVGNTKGHYENLDFYHFHIAVLESQGIHSAGWTLQEKIDVEDRFVEKAKEIIKTNSLSQIWGWKEPRTTLFLDFWAELLPEAKFIFIYRYPWEVIDSLYRRGDHIFQSQPDMAIKIWLHYNQKILNCYHRFPDRCHLASLDNIIGATDKYINSVNQKLQIKLIYSGANVYEPLQLQKLSLDSYRPSLVAHYFSEAIQMYQELEARAWQPQGNPDFSWWEKINARPYKIWAFQDWVNIRNLETENKAIECQVEQSQSQLRVIQGELAESQSQLRAIQGELAESQSHLQQTEDLLGQYQSQLHQTEDLLGQYQSQLHQTEDVSAEYQSKIVEIESLLQVYQSQLYQTEAVLEEYHTELKQKQTQVNQLEENQQTFHCFVNDLRNQLYQVEDVLIEYQTQFEEVEVIALKSQTELQDLKAQFETKVETSATLIGQLHQAEELLSEYKTHIKEFEAITRNYQDKYHKSEDALHKYQTELKLSESEHDRLIEELSILDQQTKQRGEIITEKQETIMQLEAVKNNIQQESEQLEVLLQEYQSHIDELQQTLEDLLSSKQDEANTYQQEMNKMRQNQVESEIALANSQSQLKATQLEIEQLKSWQTFNDSQVSEGGVSKYKTLVWQGWQAYKSGNYGQMANYLQQSLSHASWSRAQAIIDWIENFSRFASAQGTDLDIYSLTNLPEWQQLVRQAVRSSPGKPSVLAGSNGITPK
jgi:hypothetical protein